MSFEKRCFQSPPLLHIAYSEWKIRKLCLISQFSLFSKSKQKSEMDIQLFQCVCIMFNYFVGLWQSFCFGNASATIRASRILDKALSKFCFLSIYYIIIFCILNSFEIFSTIQFAIFMNIPMRLFVVFNFTFVFSNGQLFLQILSKFWSIYCRFLTVIWTH